MSEFLKTVFDSQIFILVLVGTLLTMVLRMSRPALRKEMRMLWAFLILAALSAGLGHLNLGTNLIGGKDSTLSNFAHSMGVVFVVLALIQILVLFIFQLLLPLFKFVAPRIAQDLTLSALWLVWGLYWLGTMGADPSRLFATSAIITAVVAFAMQDTLGNILGGVALQLDNSLRIGDFMIIDDQQGTVVDVRWRYTAIENKNQEIVIVPNSWLMKNRYRVLRSGLDDELAWRRTLVFDVDTHIPPARVVEVMNQAVIDSCVPHVSSRKKASAVLTETTSGFNRIALRYWLTDPAHDSSTDSLIRMHVLAALTRSKIALGTTRTHNFEVNDLAQQQLEQERELASRLAAVQRTALFANLPLLEQVELAGHLIYAPFVKGGVMTRQGSVAHWLYLIVQGEVQVNRETEGKITPIATLSDGDFFGELGMLTGEPRSATVVALTQVECFRLDKEGFAQILHSRPEIAEEISVILERRQRDLAERLQQAKLNPNVQRRDELLSRIKGFFGVAD